MEPHELDAWAASAAQRLGVTLAPGDVSNLLDLARDAAHGVTRPAAPLTAYLAGVAVGSGRSFDEAARLLREAIADTAP